MKKEYVILIISVILILLVYYFRTTISGWFSGSGNPISNAINSITGSSTSSNTSGLNFGLSISYLDSTSGPEVTQVQNWLNGLGYTCSITGTFDDQTDTAFNNCVAALNAQAAVVGNAPISIDEYGFTLTDFLNLCSNAGYNNVESGDYTSTNTGITFQSLNESTAVG